MELRAFAETVLLADDLEAKLRPVASAWTDERPGEAVRVEVPTRPANLAIVERGHGLPKREAFRDPSKRGLAHHVMANHELQALEVMAFVLLAYPEAPAEFRRGLADVMVDEQRHTRMHAERAAALGVPFGSRPVNGYIWRWTREIDSVLDYVARLPLVFEGANLDHTLELEEWFTDVGDEKGAAVVRRIHHDEIEHVAFGLEWLRRLKPEDETDWDAWRAHLTWPLRPAKAKGTTFVPEPRLAAGMSRDFVERIHAADPSDESERAG